MSEIKVDTLTGKTTAKTITVTVGTSATMSLEQGLAKVYALYDMTSPTSLTTSFGVSSLLDQNVGLTTFTWTTAFSDGDWVGSCGGQDGRTLGGHPSNRTTTTGQFNSRVSNTLSTSDDIYNAFSILGDLA